MNIIITLPQELIAEILNGHKTIVLRKTYPKYYRENIDWVYVVTKDKHTVQMAFQITEFNQASIIERVWKFYRKHLCIPYDWFEKYTHDAPYVFLWNIGKIAIAEKPIPLYDIKSFVKCPRCYVYCDTPLAELPFTIMRD